MFSANAKASFSLRLVASHVLNRNLVIHIPLCLKLSYISYSNIFIWMNSFDNSICFKCLLNSLLSDEAKLSPSLLTILLRE